MKTPRHKRTKDFRRIALTGRDIAIMLSVYENRFLRRDQIERLFFGTTSKCNHRLQALYQHQFLDRLYPPVEFGSSQAVYALDTRGAEVVATKLGISPNQINWTRRHNRVENLFMEHTLGVSEAHVSLEVALRLREEKDVKLLFWKREAFLPKEKIVIPDKSEKKISLIPDAFFGLELPQGKCYFFVEVDMSTETLDRFKAKIIAYREYWKTGKFNERYNYHNFRVLTITTGPKRLNNLIQVAGNVGTKNMFLFTVSELASSDFLGDIWYRPTTLDPTSILG